MATSLSLIPIFLQLLLLSVSSILGKSIDVACNEKDRQILAVFKQGIHDPFNWLSSWSTEDDCCKWTGIQCDNITGRVTKLSLQVDFIYEESKYLEGEINLSVLLELEFLKSLDLSGNNFKTIFTPIGSHKSHPHVNFSGLHYLDLSYNFDLHMNNLGWLSHVPSLKYLNLNTIDLHHDTSWLQSVAKLPSLLELRLEYCLKHCNLECIKPPLRWYVNSTTLELLDLSYNDLNGLIPDWLFQFGHLKHLYLFGNSFYGPIPITLGNLSSLVSLELGFNLFNGIIPPSLWQLSNLEDLSLGGNPLLEGTVGGENFTKLSNLKALDLRSSSFVFHWDANWTPPFQLSYILFGDSNLGPILPPWMYTQRFMEELDISNSGISSIDHDKFWKMATTVSWQLDLSGNSIGGDISNVIINAQWIELHNNNFSGGLPRISSNVTTLVMHNNFFSGPISHLLCHGMNEKNNLEVLNISYNLLSGELPVDCWLSWKSLMYLNLASNNLTGKISDSLGLLTNLRSLHLSENRFFGEMPASLKNNSNLFLLDLERNNFSGSPSSWMGKNLEVLKLRSNQFSGIIPPEICQLASLLILDLADNRLSGPIPRCLSNITAMVNVAGGNFIAADSIGRKIDALSMLIKGQEVTYSNYLKLVHLVDLSCNDLSGPIPAELFHLSALRSLNLSWNQLIGKLPLEIGSMKNLESLDLSRNLLSSEIPQSMSNLTFLGVLNLSYNHFSGKIPLGTQLQSFDEYSYIGNIELCGVPLRKSCAEEKKQDGAGALQEKEDKSEKEGFYMGMGVGFATSFWAVCIALFFKRSWRHAYFRFLNDIKDRLYVMVVLKMNYFHRHQTNLQM